MKKKFVHKCELGIEYKTISAEVKKTSLFTYIYRQLFLISPNVYHRKVFKISQFRAKKERVRHLKSYPRIIHPLSRFRFYWEIFMICIFLLQILSMPKLIIVKSEFFMSTIAILNGVFSTICIIDFSLNFVSGCADYRKHVIILEPKEFINYYCTTYAIPDFIASFPVGYIYAFQKNKSVYSIKVIFIISKFFHIFRLLHYLNNTRLKREYALHKYKICRTILIYFVLFSYCISLTGLARNKDLKMRFRDISYRSCLGAAANMILGLEHDSLIIHARELSVHVLGRIFGTILNIIFLAQLVTFLLCTYEPRFNYYRQQREMEEYMFLNELSPLLKKRVHLYYKLKYEEHLFNEHEIWSQVSDDMKQKSLYIILQDYLKQDIFSLCPEEAVILLMPYLRKHLLLPHDVLYEAKSLNTYFFFVHIGSVRILTEDGDEVAVLNDGHIFIDVIPVNSERMYTVVANEPSNIYILKYKYLYEILIDYPDAYEKVRNVLRRKTEVILKSPKNLDLQEYYKIEDESNLIV